MNTQTHHHRQKTPTQKVAVSKNRVETSSIERRATFSDKKRRANKSVRVQKVSFFHKTRIQSHEDHVAGRGFHSWHHCFWYTLLCRQAKPRKCHQLKLQGKEDGKKPHCQQIRNLPSLKCLSFLRQDQLLLLVHADDIKNGSTKNQVSSYASSQSSECRMHTT